MIAGRLVISASDLSFMLEEELEYLLEETDFGDDDDDDDGVPPTSGAGPSGTARDEE